MNYSQVIRPALSLPAFLILIFFFINLYSLVCLLRGAVHFRLRVLIYDSLPPLTESHVSHVSLNAEDNVRVCVCVCVVTTCEIL